MKRSQKSPQNAEMKAKTELIQLRLTAAEKGAFIKAADLDHKSLSEWMRDRLRVNSREELGRAGQLPAFLANSGSAAPGELMHDLSTQQQPLERVLESLLMVPLASLATWCSDKTKGGERQARSPACTISELARRCWSDKGGYANRLVKVTGSFSTLAPLSAELPFGKRERLLRYREKLKFESAREPAIDAKLARSSGQLVWSVDLASEGFVLGGLYESIVRNGFPVFVDHETFADVLTPQFNAHHTAVLEVEVTGVCRPILPFGKSAADIGLIGLPEAAFDKPDLAKSWVIIVDRSYPASSIKVRGRGRYLDGDLWAAVRKKEKGGDSEELFLIAPGVDLSDQDDLLAHLEALAGQIAAAEPCDLILRAIRN